MSVSVENEAPFDRLILEFETIERLTDSFWDFDSYLFAFFPVKKACFSGVIILFVN